MIKCFIGLHKWEYSDQEIDQDLTFGEKNDISYKGMYSLLSSTRLCKHCNRKEYENVYNKWIRTDLTPDERRVKNLNDLLK